MTLLGEIWAVAGVAGPLDVRVLVGGVTSYKQTVGLVPVRLITAGVDAAAITVQNLSASPIEIGVDRGLSYGQGTQIPARSQWSPIGGVSSIGAAAADLTVARPHYYDRNPLTKGNQYNNAGLAPHILVQRWIRTVPAGKLYYLQSAIAVCQRITVAAPAVLAGCYVRVTTSDAVQSYVVYAVIAGNVVGERESVNFGGSGILKGGDIIEGYTFDSGTGGTVLYNIGAFGVEADA